MDISKVPSYSQIWRRMRKIQLSEEPMSKSKVIDLAVDTTRLKVYLRDIVASPNESARV